MLLLELRYNKPALVDKIMAIVDDVMMGGNPQAGEMLAQKGIDTSRDPEELRRELLMMDEYAVAKLYRQLAGGM